MSLDKIDCAILNILQVEGRISNAELSERVNLSPTPCLKRVKKLEQSGYIKKYKAVLDPEKMGYQIHALVLMKIGDTKREAVTAFGAAVRSISSVQECYMTTGQTDYVARVYARDFQHYETIVKDDLACLPNIVSMETLFLFSNVLGEENGTFSL